VGEDRCAVYTLPLEGRVREPTVEKAGGRRRTGVSEGGMVVGGPKRWNVRATERFKNTQCSEYVQICD